MLCACRRELEHAAWVAIGWGCSIQWHWRPPKDRPCVGRNQIRAGASVSSFVSARVMHIVRLKRNKCLVLEAIQQPRAVQRLGDSLPFPAGNLGSPRPARKEQSIVFHYCFIHSVTAYIAVMSVLNLSPDRRPHMSCILMLCKKLPIMHKCNKFSNIVQYYCM